MSATSSQFIQPGGDNSQHTKNRKRSARVWQSLFLLSTVLAVIALLVLIGTIIDQSFGLVAIEMKVDPQEISSTPLSDLTTDDLIQVLRDNLNKNRVRVLERDNGPLAEMDREQLIGLVTENIIQPEIVKSYNLAESIFNREAIEAEVAEKYPNAKIEFRAWLTAAFLTNPMSPQPEQAGVRTAILGSLFLIFITISFAFPVGVSAAIYLEEYADRNSRLYQVIQTNIDNLAGVPSIVYGILGLAIFVRVLEPITSGAVFGVTDSNGRTILSAGLTMGILVLPLMIINAQEAIRAVPGSLREASYGLGATQWQTIWHHVLPYALPGILTGTILAVSRAIGETAPLIVIGASTVIFNDPDGLFSKFTALPIQIYNWTSRPQAEFRNIAAAAILVLMISLLSLNAVAILLRNRFSRR
jgi:phosphate transport system permease protein